MKLSNKSTWATADLWDFLKEALRQYGYEGDLTVEVVKSRKRIRVSCRRGDKSMRLGLPRDGGAEFLNGSSVLYLARVVWWVLGFLREWPRRELKGWRTRPVAWVAGRVIRRQELPQPMSKAEKLDKLRVARAKLARSTVTRLEDRIKRLDKALKLTQKRLTKAQRRVCYYEKNETAQDLADRIKAKLASQADPQP
jgi:hypothetical protein